MSGITDKQVEQLQESLLKENVKQRDGTGGAKLSYIASPHAINEANRIFGFDGWDSEILFMNQVDKTEYEKPPRNPGDDPKPMVSISYICRLRLVVRFADTVVVREDVGFGNGVAGNTAYGIGSCIELASKECVTDALKRCLRYYGNKFGLSLYDKDSAPLPDMGEAELAKPVTDQQLSDLRSLYGRRDIDDEWVIELMKAEHYNGTLEEMNQDWYQYCLKLVSGYKMDEIKAENYEVEIKNSMRLMKESATFNMSKALFKEIWTKATEQGDKETQKEAKTIYDELKEKFEPKGEKE